MKNKGVYFGLSAYVLWGLVTLYWKIIVGVSPLATMCYRIVWSFVFMVLFIVLSGKKTQFLQEARLLWKNKAFAGLIVLASVLISINWFTFIFAVSAGHVMQASLGYYINPLVNVLLATVFLKERLSRTGMLACLLASIGVILLSIQTGTIPYASLIMAFSFSTYGLIKKRIPISSVTGLTIETMVIFPFALVYILGFSTVGFMNYPLQTNLLLMGAGIVTAIPLLLFAEAAKNVSYITLGFIQYVNPTIMLLLAIFLFHETYSLAQFFPFAFIWLGIAVFTYGTLGTAMKERRMGQQRKQL
ncbi:EamA family transporter RarD [Enterococcus casseliflavus]|uniref:EamA family transporter RarD n=1 Tax=Enterococcus casseliflavus TaxID=37734 RepID=UPI0018AA9772|nr:EamA family transporter RarD [Enterococcus casseliflavus]